MNIHLVLHRGVEPVVHDGGGELHGLLVLMLLQGAVQPEELPW